jgi:hypothetical protein
MTMSEDDYLEHVDNYDGYCAECDDITRDGMTEGDAENYPCDQCGKNTCMGIEQALIVGKIEIE